LRKLYIPASRKVTISVTECYGFDVEIIARMGYKGKEEKRFPGGGCRPREREETRMRKREILALALGLLMLCGCGGGQGGEAETPAVDLSAVRTGMEEACGWEKGYLEEIEGVLLEEYYPGLSGVPAKQLIALVPAMSSDVNELVLFQGETEEDAGSAAAILQARIDSQVEGGAWYAETLEAWQGAKVLRQGTYAALIASGEFQETLEEQFDQWFS